MTDIAALVTRLRDMRPAFDGFEAAQRLEAADALEALQAELRTWHDTHDIIVEARNDALEEAAVLADHIDHNLAADIRALKEVP